jgi:hypothetical protein
LESAAYFQVTKLVDAGAQKNQEIKGLLCEQLQQAASIRRIPGR